MKHIFKFAALAFAAFSCIGASAQEDVIRKNLAERVPQFKVIDEVSKTSVPGFYEVRVGGSEVFYTDEQANYLFQGNLIDLKTKQNLTQERIDRLTAVKFDDLPLKDAFTIVRGDGKRKLAVFEDPNCGYCKRFERDLQGVNNVTVYMFLYPILGADSLEKSKSILCSKDKSTAWLDWMVRDKPLATNTNGCDVSALGRNVEFGKKHKITGTPTLILVNGARIPGAIDAKAVEKALAEASKS